MVDRTEDRHQNWSIDRLGAGILTILEDWFARVVANAISQLVEMQGLIDDTTLRSVRLDASTHAQIITVYEHHEIHGGDHYKVEDVSDLALGNVFDLTFQTPNTAKWTHFTFDLQVESETEWYIYEGVSVINPLATVVTPRNNNRNSANASGNTLRYEKQANLAAANGDTNVGAPAIQIAHGIIGAGKNAGFLSRAEELVLKQNTIYCMRAIANTAGYIAFHMGWYEHTDKN